MADPITDAWDALMRGETLCWLGLMVAIVMMFLLFIIVRIKRVRSEAAWAYNPDKTFKLRWRRG